MSRKIKISNTLTGRKETLQPLEKGTIKMYACGVTTYDESHIGHAMQAIFFDIIRKYLEYAGYKVIYVRNYTDVDDKIIARAEKLGMSPRTLADRMIRSTDNDLKQLQITPATFEPKVSETIEEIIDMVHTLIEKGAAYACENGDVYYRVKHKSDYGKLSNRNIDDLKTGNRELSESQKEDHLDFALWKNDSTKDASWPSPWGRGRPGWHIECSAMAKKFLGNSFDIHGGGRDLVFPHHENEIAQSESANCCDYASVWIHSGLLTINKQKMSKSLGNSITIKEFLKTWPAEVLRLSYLQNHYSSHIDFNEDVFKTSRKRLLYYYETYLSLTDYIGSFDASTLGKEPKEVHDYRLDFHKAMDDDFNTAEAIATLNSFMRKTNQLLTQKKSQEKRTKLAHMLLLLKEWREVFGLLSQTPSDFIATLKEQLLKELNISDQEILSLIELRNTARNQKDWTKSDEIRDSLLARGILLKDSPSGTQFTFSFDE